MKPDQLPQALEKIFSEYTESVYTKVGNSADDVGQETVETLKAMSPKRKGKYARSWTMKRTVYNGREIKVTVYNAKHYQLTHLLENGHVTRDGTKRTASFPHIAPAEKEAAEKFEQRIKLEVGSNK